MLSFVWEFAICVKSELWAGFSLGCYCLWKKYYRRDKYLGTWGYVYCVFRQLKTLDKVKMYLGLYVYGKIFLLLSYFIDLFMIARSVFKRFSWFFKRPLVLKHNYYLERKQSEKRLAHFHTNPKWLMQLAILFPSLKLQEHKNNFHIKIHWIRILKIILWVWLGENGLIYCFIC